MIAVLPKLLHTDLDATRKYTGRNGTGGGVLEFLWRKTREPRGQREPSKPSGGRVMSFARQAGPLARGRARLALGARTPAGAGAPDRARGGSAKVPIRIVSGLFLEP